MRLNSLVLIVLLAVTGPFARALAVDCDSLLASEPQAQRAMAKFLAAVEKTKVFENQPGLLNRMRYSLSHLNVAYRSVGLAAMNARLKPAQKFKVCQSAEQFVDGSESFSTHSLAILDLITEICQKSQRNGFGVAAQAMKTAQTLGSPAQDAAEIAKHLLLDSKSFDDVLAATSLPKKQWSALAPILNPLQFISYRLRLNPADETIAADLEARMIQAETENAEVGMDWDVAGATKLMSDLLYQRQAFFPPIDVYVPIFVWKPIYNVLNTRAVLHFGSPLQIKMPRRWKFEVTKKWNYEFFREQYEAREGRAELAFGHAVVHAKDIWKQQRAAVKEYGQILEQIPLSSAEQFIELFTVSNLLQVSNAVKAGDQTESAIRLKAIAEVYFPALRKRLIDLPSLKPTLDQVRAILELWKQFPELTDAKNHVDLVEDVLGIQFNLSSWATSSVGTSLPDVMRLQTFEAPPGDAKAVNMKKAAQRIAADLIVARGDGQLRWLDFPDIEPDPALQEFSTKEKNSYFRFLLELRQSVPATDRTEAAIYARAVELLVASADPAKVTDTHLHRALSDLNSNFGPQRLRDDLLRFLKARGGAPNRQAEIVVSDAQAEVFYALAEAAGYAQPTAPGSGDPLSTLSFEVKRQ